MRQIGKIGKINLKANKKILEMFEDNDISHCEINLPGCDNFFLQRVHRHKRVWYRSCLEKLWDFKQVVCGCQSCHEKLEKDRKLTESTFLRLRGEE